jgi:hypothetical protein
VSDVPVAPGEWVEITALEGLTMQVKHSAMQPANPPTP